MGSPVDCWSRCNQKLSSIINSTRLSLLLTTLIFLSVSSAPTEEPRRCYWCGPLAEQVHRSRRARPCTAPLQETVCEAPHHYCATVALAPPYIESRLCVKMYQDECYPLYCNTTQTYKMTCPCRGDFCNGPNTPREETAFKQLRLLAAAPGRSKRAIQEKPNTTAAPTQTRNKIDDSSSERSGPEYSDYPFGNIAARRDTDYDSGETSISTLNSSEKGDDSEINGVKSWKTHDAIVNDSDDNMNPDKDNNAIDSTGATKETKGSEKPTTATADTTFQSEHDTNADDDLTVTATQPVLTTQLIIDENTYSTTQSVTSHHTIMSSDDDKLNDSNDIFNQELYQPTRSKQSSTNSTERSFNASSDKPSDGDGSHISNEISNEHGVTTTSTEFSKQSISTPKINKVTLDDIGKDHQPTAEVLVDDINEVHASVTSTEYTLNDADIAVRNKDDAKTNKETTESNENYLLTTTQAPNHDFKENNKEQRPDTSETPTNKISYDPKKNYEEQSRNPTEALPNEISHDPKEHNDKQIHVPAEASTNETTHDSKENNEGQKRDTSEGSPNEISQDPKEHYEEQKHKTSEPNEILTTRLLSQDTNPTSAYSIEILDQKVEEAGEVDTNFNDICKHTGTCIGSGPSTAHDEITKKLDTETEANKEPMATQSEIKEDVIESPTMPTEETVDQSENKEDATTQKPANITGANTDKPAESVTTVSTTIRSKVELSTESTSTSGIKMSKQTKAKNFAITARGSLELVINALIYLSIYFYFW